MIFLLIVLLLTACENAAGITLTSATDIINHAKSASLTDASFTIANNVPAGVPTPGPNALTFSYSGTGVYTAHPLRFDLKLAVDFLGLQANIEEIIDGQDTYVQSPPQATWQKSSPSDSSYPSFGSPNLYFDYSVLHNVTLVGTEKLKGVGTYHLKATVSLPPGPAQGTETEELWIRQDNFFPQQIIQTFVGKSGSSSPGATVSVSGTLSTKIVLTKWNTGVTIQIPPTTTPTPTPLPGPFSGTPDYSDPLADNSAGEWTTFHNQYASCIFKDGRYHAQVTPNFGNECLNSTRTWSDFAMQVNMTILADGATVGGIDFRHQSSDGGDARGYELIIFQNGRMVLARCPGPLNCSITLANKVVSGFRQGLNKTNTIGVIAQGAQISIYVNGRLVISVRDSTYKSGYIGLSASYANRAGDVAYSDFNVWVK